MKNIQIIMEFQLKDFLERHKMTNQAPKGYNEMFDNLYFKMRIVNENLETLASKKKNKKLHDVFLGLSCILDNLKQECKQIAEECYKV
jgi:hypothetical protein